MPSQWTAGQAMHSWFSKHPGVVVEVGRRSESDRDERKHKEPCLGLGLWLPDFPHTHRSLGARSLQLPGCASFRSSNDARAAGEIPPCKRLSVRRCSVQSVAVATLPPSRTGWEAAGVWVPLWENQAAARWPQLLGNQPRPCSSPHSAPGSWGLRCSYMNNFSGSLRTKGYFLHRVNMS